LAEIHQYRIIFRDFLIVLVAMDENESRRNTALKKAGSAVFALITGGQVNPMTPLDIADYSDVLASLVDGIRTETSRELEKIGVYSQRSMG